MEPAQTEEDRKDHSSSDDSSDQDSDDENVHNESEEDEDVEESDDSDEDDDDEDRYEAEMEYRRGRYGDRWFGHHDEDEEDSEHDSDNDSDNDSNSSSEDSTEEDDSDDEPNIIDDRPESEEENEENQVVEYETPQSGQNRSMDVDEDNYFNEEQECSVVDSESDDEGSHDNSTSRAKKKQKVDATTAVAAAETKVELSTDMLAVVVEVGFNYRVQILQSDNGAVARQLIVNADIINGIEFSPDCSKIAEYGEGVRVWEIGSGKRMMKINCRGNTTCVQFSHKGDRLLCRSLSGSVRVWDLESQLKVAYFFCHDPIMREARFSTDDKLIICSSQVLVDNIEKSRLKIWNVDNGELVKALRPTRNRLKAMATTSDSSQLVVGCAHGRLIFYDISELCAATPNAISISDTLNDPDKDTHHSLCFTSDSRALISGQKNRLTVWDIVTGTILRRIPTEGYVWTRVSANQANDRIAVGDRSRSTWRVYNMGSGSLMPSTQASWQHAVYSRSANVLL